MSSNMESNWLGYFREHGCKACGRKDVEYAQRGMCRNCTTAPAISPQGDAVERKTNGRRQPRKEPTKGISEQREFARLMSHYCAAPKGLNECAWEREKALRASAFLLHWSSSCGNKPVHGLIAQGIAHILDMVADEVCRPTANGRGVCEVAQ